MQRIAILCRSAYGDLICTLPMIYYLRHQYPNAEFTLFCDERNAAITPFFPNFLHVVVIRGKGNKYINVLGTAWRWRKHRYDLVVCAKPEPMKLYNLFTFVLNAKRRIAAVEDNWHGRLVNEGVPFDASIQDSKHQALKVLNLVAPDYQSVPVDLYPKLSVSVLTKEKYQPGIDETYDAFTGKAALGPFVLISVSNNRSFCLPSVENYAEIINAVQVKRDFSVLISCMPSDLEKAKDLSKRLMGPCVIVPTPDFAAFMTLLSTVDACFVGEGGVMHMAAAMEIPQLILSAKTNMDVWRPLSRCATVLQDDNDVDRIDKHDIINQLTKLIQFVSTNQNELPVGRLDG